LDPASACMCSGDRLLLLAQRLAPLKRCLRYHLTPGEAAACGLSCVWGCERIDPVAPLPAPIRARFGEGSQALGTDYT